MVNFKIFSFFIFLFFSSCLVSSEIINYNGINYVSINISEGWNVISGISFNQNDFLPDSEVNQFGLWKADYWDAKNQNLVEIRPIYSLGNDIDPLIFYSSAFWVFSGVPGQLIYKASPSFINRSKIGGYYLFYSGNNLIAINDEMYNKSINEIKGDCEVLKVVFWDAKKQNWTGIGINDKLDFIPQKYLVGLGINVNVSSDCKFFSNTIDICGDGICSIGETIGSCPEDCNTINLIIKIIMSKLRYGKGEVILLR